MNDLRQLQHNCRAPVFTDDLTRCLYATDASVYRVMPRAVAFPRSAAETAELMQAAAAEGVPIIPRGAGSGLAGGALGDGLIVDMSRYNRFIMDLDGGRRTVRVGAGVVLDPLNAFLAPWGWTFGPDVATSSRATLGGMIANNSSGARAPYYGTTLDHVAELEVVTARGEMLTLGPGSLDSGMADTCISWPAPLADIVGMVRAHRPEVERRFHQEICKRWPGYGLDRFARSLDGTPDPAQLIGGSEGTLCTVFSATLKLSPLPLATGLGLLFFDSVEEAIAASTVLLDLEPAGLEHIDDLLFDQTRGQRAFEAARALLGLDDQPCRAILLVEFYDHIQDKLEAMIRLKLGTRHLICANEREKALVWHLRKAGLSLLTGCPGFAKPTEGIEDVAVPPRRLPEYAAALRSALGRLGLRASFYGHAGAGLLHVRPILDLHRQEDVVKYRAIVEEVASLARQFDGSLTAEHGAGIARTEFVADQVGPNLLEIMRAVKRMFDPDGLMNPGKVLDDGTWRMDRHLRLGPGSEIRLPFEPILLFDAKDHSFVGNLEQCNGCGGCRKDPPVMCPTYQATGDELMSTRGRANIIRAVLDGTLAPGRDPLHRDALEQALAYCLSCKACTTECPSNVNMALLKAELLHARRRKQGIPLAARLLSRVDLLGAAASLMPGIANRALDSAWVRRVLHRVIGLAPQRPLPHYARQRFDAWFRNRPGRTRQHGERVLLWDDCFVRHNEPHIGRAAVAVLEAAGHEVALVAGHACCGRPAFSMGRLDVARRFGERNISLLRGRREPIIFLEPSCYAMFREEYRELGLNDAQAVAERAVLFEQFIDHALDTRPESLTLHSVGAPVAIHAHCHAKAMTDIGVLHRLASRIPETQASLLDTGCCGMAGAFGAMEKTYDLSLKIAEPLTRLIAALPEDVQLVASGASCRHQIEYYSNKHPIHFAELLARAAGNTCL